MAVVAEAAKNHGGMLMGIVPTVIEERGLTYEGLDVLFHAVNLSDRKDLMLQESDILVALPGGIGTLDEVFHVLASGSIGYHDKRVILYNIDHFWDGLVELLGEMQRQGFVHRRLHKFLLVANTLDELTTLLDEGTN